MTKDQLARNIVDAVAYVLDDSLIVKIDHDRAGAYERLLDRMKDVVLKHIEEAAQN